MTSIDVARNIAQKIPTVPIKGLEVLQPFTWYTCPANKKAIIKGTCVCRNLGAAASANLVLAGVNDASWKTTGGIDINKRDDLATDQVVSFEVQLDAGETMLTNQNTGTNAEFQVNATVQESPA